MSVLKELSGALTSKDTSILKNCQGTFSLCWYNFVNRELVLATDKLGARPLYYYKDKNFIFFSGALYILEALDSIPKRMDLIALTEELILGSPLGARTPYADMKVLRGGEYLKVEGLRANTFHYFRWADVPSLKGEMDELLKHAYTTFATAMESRAWRDSTAVSALSGGLDSRCIVTSLWEMGKKVFTGNLAFPESQDAVYAKEYARKLGLNFRSFPRYDDEQYKENIFTDVMSKLASELEVSERYPPKFSRLIFSGDGGSVGLGHVYMNEHIVANMRNNRIEKTISNYLKNRILPRRLLTKHIYPQLKSALHEEVRKELSAIAADDPGRNFYIYLLDNDQRRHLRSFFENIGEHRLEFLLPFYDGSFLENIVATPVDLCFRHEFYTRLLDLFPNEIKSVPWQTYPGHVPCPLEEERNLSYQWSPNEGRQNFYSKLFFKRCKSIALQQGFTNNVLNRAYIIAALGLHTFRIKNFSSEFRFGVILQEYYNKCDGDVFL
jgi:hypothetical protein